MEAKRRPRDVGKKITPQNVHFNEMMLSYNKTHVFEGADLEIGASNRQKSCHNRKETARRRVRQARRDKKDSKKDKKRSRSKTKSPGGVTDIEEASTELRPSFDPAATGVIFGVDVVPLSILAS